MTNETADAITQELHISSRGASVAEALSKTEKQVDFPITVEAGSGIEPLYEDLQSSA